jgi:hypothetical protein
MPPPGMDNSLMNLRIVLPDGREVIRESSYATNVVQP